MHPYQDYGLKRASPPTSFDRSVVQRPGNATDVRSGAGLSANLRMLGDAPTRQTNETIPVAFMCSSRTQTDKDRLKGIAPSKLVFASSDKTHYRAGHRGHMLDSDAMAYLASTESVNEHLKQEAGAGRGGGATLLTYRPMGVCINHFGSGVSGSGSDPLDAFSAQVYNVAVEGVCTVEAEGGWADARVGDQLVLCLGDSGWEQEVARNVKVGGPCWVIGIVLDAGAEVPGALAVYGGNGTNRKLTVHLSISLHQRQAAQPEEKEEVAQQQFGVAAPLRAARSNPRAVASMGNRGAWPGAVASEVLEIGAQPEALSPLRAEAAPASPLQVNWVNWPSPGLKKTVADGLNAAIGKIQSDPKFAGVPERGHLSDRSADPSMAGESLQRAAAKLVEAFSELTDLASTAEDLGKMIRSRDYAKATQALARMVSRVKNADQPMRDLGSGRADIDELGRQIKVTQGKKTDPDLKPAERAMKASDGKRATRFAAQPAEKSVPAAPATAPLAQPAQVTAGASAAAPLAQPAQPAQVTAGASAAESAPAAPYVARPERGDRGPSRR